MLSRERILQILSDNREELRRDFGVVAISLFGSAARGEAGPTSDVDVLVDVHQQISLFELVALRLRLEERQSGRQWQQSHVPGRQDAICRFVRHWCPVRQTAAVVPAMSAGPGSVAASWLSFLDSEGA